MKIIEDEISINELKQLAENSFGDFVKAVVDIEKEIMAIDADLHSDEESLLLQNGSLQIDLWGINIYPFESIEKLVVFDSLINIRPKQDNRSRDVESPEIREIIIRIVTKLIKIE